MENLQIQIKDILFQMSKEIKVHKIDSNNLIFEIDYEGYAKKIINLFEQYLSE